MGGAGGRVKVVDSKGCSRLFLGFPSPFSSFRALQQSESMSIGSITVGSEQLVRSNGPFQGLVICVTGLSKEARKQVREATERLGGQYSPHLHLQCTHLVVQSFGGRKLEHALKHGSKNGLFVVTLGWFVESVKKNVRLRESLYGLKSVGENCVHSDEMNRLVGFNQSSCLPFGVGEAKQSDMMEEEPYLQSYGEESIRYPNPTLFGRSIYIDSHVSAELRHKVSEIATKQGATFLDRWFVGCGASHVVCEGHSLLRYLGHSDNLVTPLWVLKTEEKKYMQRLVCLSVDLARQVGTMLVDFQNGTKGEGMDGENGHQASPKIKYKPSHEERQQIVNLAKTEVRKRRGRRMQTCQTPIRPINPSSLLDSICWSISEPTSSASIYTDSYSSEDVSEQKSSIFFDAKGDGKESDAYFANFTRPLTESEKTELVLKDRFLTIMFPVDRFSEMGPSSRTFFSDKGFTCWQVLDHIYAFYQENMSDREIEAAIHTDSRHADRLRSVYSSKETTDSGYVNFKRIDFLGSRKSFEMLKRVNGDNNSNVYELLIRA